MELDNIGEIIEILKQVPVYAWIIIAVILLVLFGDRKKWDLRAKFPDNGVRGRHGGTGPGYVEIDCYRKKGMIISVALRIDDKYSTLPAEIYIKNQLALRIPAEKTKWGIIRYKGAYRLNKPDGGDQVDIRSNGETILSSTMD